jgi:hypothetical protein
MRIAAHNRFDQATAIISALSEAGHEILPVGLDHHPDVLLLDLDIDDYGYRDAIDFYKERDNAIVLLYPHGGGVSHLMYDSICEPYPAVDGQLTQSDGDREYFRAIGLQRPICPIGWFYCAQAEFRPCEKPQNVLFAPIHPSGDGSIRSDYRTNNEQIFLELLQGPWQITVRYIGQRPQDSGIWLTPEVSYIHGAMDQSTVEIDCADVVVAGCGTFPALSIARGVPTIVYGQYQAGRGLATDEIVSMRHLDRYRDLITYPYDCTTAPLDEMIEVACKAEATQWRRDWIGKQFDPEIAPVLIENFVRELRAAQSLRMGSSAPLSTIH